MPFPLARVAEVKRGSHGSIAAASAADLPPKGPPGIKGRRLKAFVEKAQALLDKSDIDGAKAALAAGIERFNKTEA